jgi:hypothetical protein
MKKMTLAQALKLARDYTAVRGEVRKLLVAKARRRCPQIVDSETRKLHRFPSDLSDERLLRLIEGTTKRIAERKTYRNTATGQRLPGGTGRVAFARRIAAVMTQTAQTARKS